MLKTKLEHRGLLFLGSKHYKTLEREYHRFEELLIDNAWHM